ncbi:MAG: alpha/beta hydrolase [Acidimicrobiia bacterium]|nr:alpha/beta hydrolase [Acidimicrobiia bacterium]MDH5505456.1 alpha/beta hydrolase [Acidimicrobiia bacterium]
MTSDSEVRLAGWKSLNGRTQYVEAYRRAQELWEVPVEDWEIPTRFGTTHALVSGPAEAPPVFLLHAAFGTGATQWFPNVVRLSRHHRLVALDFVGAPGLGEQTAPILDRADCAAWLSDVIDYFDLTSVDLVGSSHGGWLALNLAVAQSERVRRLALLAPAASLMPFRRGAIVSIRLGPFMPGWTAWPSMRPIFGNRYEIDDRIVEVLAMSLRHYRYQQRPVYPDVFSDEELRSVRAETFVMLGDKEILYDPLRALERAGSLIPSVRTELVANTGHLLNIEQAELVDRRLLALLGSG